MLHGQAEMSAAFPLVVKYLSALSRNENAHTRLNSVGGPGRFCFYVYPAGFPCGCLAAGDPSGGFEPGDGLITNPRGLEVRLANRVCFASI